MDQTLIAGRYEIHGLAGPGFGGQAFAAMDRRLGRPVMLDLIRRPGCEDAEDRLRRALREARIAGRLAHPNILAVLDTGLAPDYAWVAHAASGGETLAAALRRNGPASVAEAARIMDEILDALAVVHTRGICHLALRPATILLTTGGRPQPRFGQAQVTGFGLARLDARHPCPVRSRGAAPDHRADIRAAGILFRQLLTGAAEPERTVLPPAFARIIARALAEPPEDRFPDADSMAWAIRVAALPAGAALPGLPLPPGPIGSPGQKAT